MKCDVCSIWVVNRTSMLGKLVSLFPVLSRWFKYVRPLFVVDKNDIIEQEATKGFLFLVCGDCALFFKAHPELANAVFYPKIGAMIEREDLHGER